MLCRRSLHLASVGSNAALPPCDVDPTFELFADLAIDADQLEANGLVKRSAPIVGQCNSGKSTMISLHVCKPLEELRIEPAPDSLAAGCSRDIKLTSTDVA